MSDDSAYWWMPAAYNDALAHAFEDGNLDDDGPTRAQVDDEEHPPPTRSEPPQTSVPFHALVSAAQAEAQRHERKGA